MSLCFARVKRLQGIVAGAMCAGAVVAAFDKNRVLACNPANSSSAPDSSRIAEMEDLIKTLVEEKEELQKQYQPMDYTMQEKVRRFEMASRTCVNHVLSIHVFTFSPATNTKKHEENRGRIRWIV